MVCYPYFDASFEYKATSIKVTPHKGKGGVKGQNMVQQGYEKATEHVVLRGRISGSENE